VPNQKIRDIIFAKAPDRKKILNCGDSSSERYCGICVFFEGQGLRYKVAGADENGVWIGAWPAV
jgi:hypothetical protein